MEKARAAIEELLTVIHSGRPLNPAMVESLMDIAVNSSGKPSEVYGDVVWTHRGRQVGPRTVNQKLYVDAIRKNTITFGIGPAGTGKTYLATAMAVAAFFGKQVGRIILTRPAVEAGESLGFLPGTVSEKVDPYFRPLFDALYDMIDGEKLATLIEKGEIEVAPLAFMRGRTLNDSFIILDEAQNTSPEQMKMFLTRLGFGSKMVVTGDVTQIDLPHSRTSGLVTVGEVLERHRGHRHRAVRRSRRGAPQARAAHRQRLQGARRRDRGGARAAQDAARPASRGERLVNVVEVVNGTRTAIDEELVARLVAKVLDEEGVHGAEVAVTFVGERRIRDLNREHRGKDEVTDVLSFPLEDWEAGDPRPTAPARPAPRPSWSPRWRPTSARWPRRSSPARPDRRSARRHRDLRAPGAGPGARRRPAPVARGRRAPDARRLHLLGYDHETDAGQMALRQAEVLELVDWEGLVVAASR